MTRRFIMWTTEMVVPLLLTSVNTVWPWYLLHTCISVIDTPINVSFPCGENKDAELYK